MEGLSVRQIGKSVSEPETITYIFLTKLFFENQLMYAIMWLISPSALGVWYIIDFLITLFFLYGLRKGVLKNALIVFLVYSTILMFSYFQFSDYLSDQIQKIFVQSVLVIFAVLQCREFKTVVTAIRTGTLISGAIMGVVYPLNEVILGNHSGKENYMVLTYMLVVGLVGYAYYGITEKRKGYILWAILLFIEVLIAGSRGGIACAVVIFLIACLHSRNNLTRQQLLKTIVLFAVITYAVLNFDSIMVVLSDFAERFGINTRSINMYLQGAWMENKSNDGRNELASQVFSLIKDNPMGYGFLSHYKLLGTYPHNVFLELLLDFGVFLGGALCVTIIVLSARNIFLNKNLSSAFAIMFAIAFVKSFFSGEIATDPFFAIFIGLILRQLFYNDKVERNCENEILQKSVPQSFE